MRAYLHFYVHAYLDISKPSLCMAFDGTAPGLPQLLNNAWLFIFTALQICLSAPGESKYLNIKAGQINVHASTGFKKEGKKK